MEKGKGTENENIIVRMSLNYHKAGMQGLDKDTINKIIFEASKNSKYYENERKKEEQVQKRIAEQQSKLEQLSESDLKHGEEEADEVLKTLNKERKLSRHIVHTDMDAFYAAVETRDNPSLKEKPMAVGDNSMLCTSNYVARRYGVRAAMPGFIARKLCPQLVIVPTNFDKYRAVSQEVQCILSEYDSNFCTMSLDEAYLDFTDHLELRITLSEAERSFPDTVGEIELCACRKQQPTEESCICSKCHKQVTTASCSMVFKTDIEDAVAEMRHRIHLRTRLTASAGIAPNTMLAKISSDKNKPNGQFRIPPDHKAIKEFVQNLPLRKVNGIGRVTEQMLSALGVEKCSDIIQHRGALYHLYSDISFLHFLRVSQGNGSTTIQKDSERKSISNEQTFAEMNQPEKLFAKCSELCLALVEDLMREDFSGKTVTVKYKTVNFEVKTRAQTLLNYTQSYSEIFKTAKAILQIEINHLQPKPLRLRLMGVRMSNLLPATQSMPQKTTTIVEMFNKMSPKKKTSDTAVQAKSTGDSSYGEAGCGTANRSADVTDAVSDTTPKYALSFQDEDSCSDLQDPQPKEKSNIFCPICDKKISTKNMTLATLHIDHCLENSERFPVSAARDQPNTVGTQELSQLNHQVKSTAPDHQVKSTAPDHQVKSTAPDKDDIDRTHYVVAEQVADTDSSGSFSDQSSTSMASHRGNLPCASSQTRSDSFICPVCACSQNVKDLEELNKHIDLCLNRRAVREIVQSQAQDSLEQSRVEKPAAGRGGGKAPLKGKKRKGEVAGLQTLTGFVKYHRHNQGNQ